METKMLKGYMIPQGAQALWVKKDLAANTQPWVIVYWHHPPYTMTSHNSDTESELVRMRTDFIKMLERYKVDLVLCGHSHGYERSYLMKGHYGLEPTFDPNTHRVSTSNALYDGTTNSCPYVKIKPQQDAGSVYVVAGSAGQLGGKQAAFPHNSMFYSDATNGGSLYLEVKDNRLDSKWICADGTIRDQFTMMKEVNKTTNISTVPDKDVTMTASWEGTYVWSPGGETTKSITVKTSSAASYAVKDNFSCLNDVFNLSVSPLAIEKEAPKRKRTKQTLPFKRIAKQ
jgi:hypothetical protein